MRICMMTNTYLPHVGGVARSVYQFTADYRRRQHAVVVVAPKYPGSERLSPRLERNVIRLPAIQQFNGSDFSVRLPLTWLVNPELQEFKPDIVHSHHPYLLGDSALRYAADNNAPVVFTHHTLHEEYTHNVPLDSPALKQFVIELCTQYANLCDAVIAPSESIAQLIQKRGVTSPIEVIPTGVDVKKFSSGEGSRLREQLGIPDAFVVGHVGRLAPEKNLGFLGRAVMRFLQSTPKAVFLVIGDGSGADELRTAFTEANMSERLFMPGAKTGQELYDAYAAMDVFAFSSQSETQGMVLTEAMAAGKPIVALDGPGVREVVKDRKNGFLLDASSSEDTFAARLEEVCRAGQLREKMSSAAKETALLFSRRESARRALDLYRAVLRRTRRERRAAEDDALTALLNRMEVEWSLIAEKASAVFKTITGEAGKGS